ncbi:MAG: peptidoglycan DD-metalloendopeptidase family protein [Acidimicrobiales bacterium]|nr:peptidoglycan DD-metalloendopeptidase family protein [Acidimicrobiales bacterium]
MGRTKIRTVVVVVVVSLLAALLTSVVAPPTATAQEAAAPAGAEWMPFIGDTELWCTMSNPGGGGFCQQAGHHTYWALDIGMPIGTPVIAAGPGAVVDLCSVGCYDGRGLFVELAHPDGTRSRYLHLSRVDVAVGQQVVVGQLLGASGVSGAATAPHLHYDERSADGELVDPGLIRACVDGTEVLYPPEGFASWLSTPYGTELRHDGGSCAAVPATPSRYVAVTPTRLLDTRDQNDPLAGIVGPQGALAVPVAGRAGVPADAVAVVANVTATNTLGNGYLTVWPTGEQRPLTSSLNHRAGETVGNLVIARLGPDGAVNVYSHAGAHVIIDVQGYYVPAETATAGRMVPLAPTRLFDTRSAPAPQGIVPSRGTVTVQATGRAGVPASGVTAVVVNLTATQALGPGYVTAWSGTTVQPPAAATLNIPGSGTTVANLAIVPLAPNGTFALYSHGGSHLVADVYGYITGAGAPADTAGLFVPLVPERAFDTRTAAAPVAGGASMDLQLAGRGHVPLGTAGAVAFNLTGIEAAGAGYLTVWPTGATKPIASALNLAAPGATRANAAIVSLSGTGSVSLFAATDAHVVADVVGYFLR